MQAPPGFAMNRTLFHMVMFGSFLLFLGGCAEGCGETKEPQEESSSGGGGGPPSSGSGDVDLSFYDSAAPRRTEAKAQPAEEKKPTRSPDRVKTDIKRIYGTFRELDPAGFNRAISGSPDVLIMTTKPRCRDCRDARNVLRGVAKEFRDIRFYNLKASRASGLIPEGRLGAPYPGFILYQNGKLSSSIKGIPVKRERAADGTPKLTDEQYNEELSEWFRWALKRRHLGRK